MITLQTSVDAYRHPDDEDDLPDNLRVDGIAMSIHLNAKHNVRDLALPRINRTATSSLTWDPLEDDDSGYSHIQGYYPRVN